MVCCCSCYQAKCRVAYRDAGLNTFRAVIVEAARIHDHLNSFVLRLIEQERTGNLVDRPLLRSIVRMFISLKTYELVSLIITHTTSALLYLVF